LVEKLAEVLTQRGLTLSIAESLTGGLLGHQLTDCPGASNWFMGGITAYSNQAKIDLLEVGEETLNTYGAVSSEVAEEMVIGCAKKFRTKIALSTTGIAGPAGGNQEKPVGLVYVGLNIAGQVWSKKCLFTGNRQEIKAQSSREAMVWLLEQLN